MLAVVLASASFFSRGSYSTTFTTDTLYLANAGYLVYHGLVPHVDFAWQFGGYDAALIALAMRLFRVSVKAVEQGVALHYLVAVMLLVLVTQRRASWPVFGLLFVLLTVTALTRYPFENGPHPNLALQSYSMWYNRIGWTLAFVVFTPLLLGPPRLRGSELVACGLAMFLILVTKITFTLLFPLAFLLIWRRSGWRGTVTVLGAIIGAMLAGWALFGFSPSAYMAMPADNYRGVRDLLAASPKFGPFDKLAYMVLVQAIPLVSLAVAGAFIWWKIPSRRGAVLATFAVVVVGLGVSVSTGTFYALDAVTPIIPFAAIILGSYALEAKHWQTASALALYVLAFATPYGLNYAAGIVKEATRSRQSIYASGPLEGLVIEKIDQNSSPRFASRQEALSYIRRRGELEGGMDWATDYEWNYLVDDAMQLVTASPDARKLRIGSFFQGISSFALGTAPLKSYSFMLGVTAPDTPQTIPADVDALLLPRFHSSSASNKHYGHDVEANFVAVATSAFWELRVRRH